MKHADRIRKKNLTFVDDLCYVDRIPTRTDILLTVYKQKNSNDSFKNKLTHKLFLFNLYIYIYIYKMWHRITHQG